MNTDSPDPSRDGQLRVTIIGRAYVPPPTRERVGFKHGCRVRGTEALNAVLRETRWLIRPA